MRDINTAQFGVVRRRKQKNRRNYISRQKNPQLLVWRLGIGVS